MLYHGTATRFVQSVLSEELKPQRRLPVHMSFDEATAQRVGQGQGEPPSSTSRRRDYMRGVYRTDNGLWLTCQVLPDFLPLSSSTTDSATTSRQPKLST